MSNKEKNIAIIFLGIIITILMIFVILTKIKAEVIKNENYDLIHINVSERPIFNSKFEKFAGSNKGSNVKTLLSQIITNNSIEFKKVYISLNGKTPVYMSSDILDLRKEIDIVKTYTVNIINYDEFGYVEQIDVNEKL